MNEVVKKEEKDGILLDGEVKEVVKEVVKEEVAGERREVEAESEAEVV